MINGTTPVSHQDDSFLYSQQKKRHVFFPRRKRHLLPRGTQPESKAQNTLKAKHLHVGGRKERRKERKKERSGGEIEHLYVGGRMDTEEYWWAPPPAAVPRRAPTRREKKEAPSRCFISILAVVQNRFRPRLRVLPTFFHAISLFFLSSSLSTDSIFFLFPTVLLPGFRP